MRGRTLMSAWSARGLSQRAADCSALVRAAADLNEYLVFASLGRSTIQNMRLVRELDLLEASLSGAPQDQV